MSFRIGGYRTTSFATAIMLVSTLAAQAQTTYPSFQQPRVVSREFNIGVADGDGATPLVFQWREGTGAGTQLSLDVGLADPESQNRDVFLILGGQYAYSLARARPDMPLDVLLTAGVFTQLGNDIAFLSVPVGTSVGHRFLLPGTGMAITPYIHPRVALQYASYERLDADIVFDETDTDLDISFDVGGSLELTSQLSLRLSATFGGEGVLGNGDGVGISLAWSPSALRTTSDQGRPSR